MPKRSRKYLKFNRNEIDILKIMLRKYRQSRWTGYIFGRDTYRGYKTRVKSLIDKGVLLPDAFADDRKLNYYRLSDIGESLMLYWMEYDVVRVVLVSDLEELSESRYV